jgi:hypothetical protein
MTQTKPYSPGLPSLSSSPPFPLPAPAPLSSPHAGRSLPLPHRPLPSPSPPSLAPDPRRAAAARARHCSWRRRPKDGLPVAEAASLRRIRARRPGDRGLDGGGSREWAAAAEAASLRRIHSCQSEDRLPAAEDSRTGGSGGGDLPPPDPLLPARGQAPSGGGTRGRATTEEATSRL